MMYLNDEVPFNVMDAYEVADLTDVKADKNLFPVTKDLRVRINKAGTQQNNNKNIYGLKLELRTVDETPVADGKSIKANYPIFNSLMDLVYGAKMDVDGRADNKWWKNSQHLVEFKNLCAALDIPLKGIKVNDQFLSELVGREVLVSVTHEAETVADPNGEVNEKTGKVKKVPTGEFNQKLRNWKKAT